MWSSNVNHTQLDKIGCMRRIGSGGSQVVVPILNMGWLSMFKGTLAFHIFCSNAFPFLHLILLFFSFCFSFFVKRLDNNYLTGKFEVNVDMNFLNFLIRKNISHLVMLAL